MSDDRVLDMDLRDAWVRLEAAHVALEPLRKHPEAADIERLHEAHEALREYREVLLKIEGLWGVSLDR